METQSSEQTSETRVGGGSAAEAIGDVWDRFDMVIALVYTGYQYRYRSLRDELGRVGLLDRVTFLWSYPSPFDSRFANSIRLSGTIRSPSQFNEAMSHYRAMKTALELGRSSVLVLEDDVRFMSDLKSLASAVRELPDDYDVAKFEWFKRGDSDPISRSGTWTRFEGGYAAAGGAAMAYTSRALEWKTSAMERAALPDDFHGKLFINDQYETGKNFEKAGLTAYLATPLLAIQAPEYIRSSMYSVGKHNGLLAGKPTSSYGPQAHE